MDAADQRALRSLAAKAEKDTRREGINQMQNLKMFQTDEKKRPANQKVTSNKTK